MRLGDAEALVLELDDDVRIEVEVVGHLREVDPRQGVQAVRPVAAVELGQAHAQSPVGVARQDLVADQLIERHPP